MLDVREQTLGRGFPLLLDLCVRGYWTRRQRTPVRARKVLRTVLEEGAGLRSPRQRLTHGRQPREVDVRLEVDERLLDLAQRDVVDVLCGERGGLVLPGRVRLHQLDMVAVLAGLGSGRDKSGGVAESGGVAG